MNLRSKLPNTPTSVFAVMTGLANEYNALNLSQGFPNFPISEKVVSLVNDYMKKGCNQYAPMPGVPQLREIIAEKLHRLYGGEYYDYNTEITVTPGATCGLYTAITATIQAGDEVILFEPAYDSYIPAIKLCGGVPKPLAMDNTDYHIDWIKVQQAITPKTRMIIINTPHNPTGSVLTQADMHELIHLTKGTDIIILSDEVYEHLIFDNLPHESVAKYPELRNRSFIMASFGKTFHATGWKMGYAAAPKFLMDEFRKIHQFNVFCCNTPVQWAFADFLSDPENYEQLPQFYRQKRNYFVQSVSSSRFTTRPCHGTYFLLLDYSRISDEKEYDFAIRMTKEHKLATVPVSPFYSTETNNHTVRVCFAKTEDTLDKAAEILNKI